LNYANIENLTDLRVNSATLEQIRDHLTDREVELIICSSDKIRDYNLEFRGKDSPTDVLSFPIDIEVERLPLGSIIISSDMVLEGAKRFKNSKDDEVALLIYTMGFYILGKVLDPLRLISWKEDWRDYWREELIRRSLIFQDWPNW